METNLDKFLDDLLSNTQLPSDEEINYETSKSKIIEGAKLGGINAMNKNVGIFSISKEQMKNRGNILYKNKCGIFKYTDEERKEINKKAANSPKKRGENNHNSKLTNEDVKFIRDVYFHTKNQYCKIPDGKMSTKQLSKKFNISRRVIQNIINGNSWKNI